MEQKRNDQQHGGTDKGLARQAPLAAAALVLLAGAVVYANSFGGQLIIDDLTSIRGNPTIRELWPIWRALSPPADTTVTGRPLINLSLAINHALGGTGVWGYHLVNLMVHLVAALALFGVVRRTLLLPVLKDRFAGASTSVGLAVALLWAVHPLQTESVTYIIQRTESMMGMFYLLTLYLVIRGGVSSRPVGWYVGAVAACALGMASKEVMATAPLVALLYDRIFFAGSFRELWRRRWGLYLGLAATWGVFALTLIGSHRADYIATITADQLTAAEVSSGASRFGYIYGNLSAIVTYLRLSFWPSPLIVDYGRQLPQTLGQILPSVAVVGLLLAATAAALRYRPRIGFVCAAFFIVLSPTTSVLDPVWITVEHRMYLPLASVVTLVVLGAHWGLSRAPLPGKQVLAAATLALAVVGLGHGTIQRNRDYASPLSIWQDTVSKLPQSARAQYNLGIEHMKRGELERALERYDRAIELSPDHSLHARSNRGMVYLALGRMKQAMEDFNFLIERYPNNGTVHFNRGVAYMKQKEYRLAGKDLTRAIELDPSNADAHYNRGNASFAIKAYRYAINDYTRAIELEPNRPDAYYNRAVCAAHLRLYDHAWADVKRMMALGATPRQELIEDLRKATGRSAPP